MDDAKYYVTHLQNLTFQELKHYCEQHPDFMINLEDDETIASLKEETFQNIMHRIKNQM